MRSGRALSECGLARIGSELHEFHRLGRAGASIGGSRASPLRNLGQDLEANFKAVLQAQLAKLDLVSRTEFDVQAALLGRTQSALAAMEQRLKEIEAKFSGS